MIFLHILIIALLTLVTQVGGAIYLFTLIFLRKLNFWKQVLAYATLYVLVVFLVVPYLAPAFGREQITLPVHNGFYVLANRNYVTTEMNEVLTAVESDFKKQHPDLKLIALDANFPFFDGFPLLPHLSHDDGRKVDLAFVYRDEAGGLTNAKPSRSGYGIFVPPQEGDLNQTRECLKSGAWQYTITEYLTFGRINSGLIFSEKPNEHLLKLLVENVEVGKVFIEPHLEERLGVKSEKIRFQGCHSVRHDDHFHVQLK